MKKMRARIFIPAIVILIGLLSAFVGCGKDDLLDDTDINLRQTGPGGGLIFYDKGSYSGSPGWRYLLAAPSDQSTGAVWGTYNFTFPGAVGSEIGTGYQNTIDIVNGDPLSTTAADICSSLILGGQSDWFLPSKDELNEMYKILKKYSLGGFTDNIYWTSTEYTRYAAWEQHFSDGHQYNGAYKNDTWYVRCIRAF